MRSSLKTARSAATDVIEVARAVAKVGGVTERFGRTSDERQYIFEALEGGVKGYVLKS